MGKFTKKQVDDYANKLLIGLTPEENKMVLDEFDDIDANIDLINEIKDIDKVEPMTHCLDDFTYTLHEDIPTTSPSVDELLQNCDKKEGREVEVPKVVG
jgi:aspartyl/glutamyl-tRNA(Asn/Gln) amidotransferase C subunit